MSTEYVEAELVSLNSKIVVVVRPSYGQQSDSWNGMLQVVKTEPIRFHFISVGQTMLFTAEDVMKLDPPVDEKTEKIIRLKGPYDYAQTYQVASH